MVVFRQYPAAQRSAPPPLHCEILVIGAGVAGATFARRVAAAGRSTILVHRPDVARPFLETLDAKHVPATPTAALAWRCTEHRALWGAGEEVTWPALLNPNGADWFVDRSRLDAALRELAIAEGALGLEGLAPTPVRRDDIWSTEIDGRQVSAAFLVDATGRRGLVSRRLGARRRELDRLVGITAPRLETAQPDTGVRIVAAPGGWWYAGPGAQGNFAIYFTDGDLGHLAAARGELGTLARQTTATMGWRLGPSEKPFSAASGALDQATGPGWLAVGDAALSVDPLSASGLSNAIILAELAAERWLSGRLDAYSDDHRRLAAAYLDARAAVYGRERRYQAHPFWRRRSPTPRLNAA